MKESALAQRYARALYMAAEEKKDISIPQVEEDLRLSWRLVQSYPHLLEELTHPLNPLEKKKATLARAIQEVRPQLSSLVRRFLDLALEKKRLALVPSIVSSFEETVLQKSNAVNAIVSVAVPLAESAKEKMREKLTQYFKKKVTLQVLVQPNLIGGIVVKVGDTVIDYSLNFQLKRFGYGH